MVAAALHWLLLRFWVAWKWVPWVLFTSLLRAGLWEHLPRPPQPRLQEDPARTCGLCCSRNSKFHQALRLGAGHRGAGTEAESFWLPNNWSAPRFLGLRTLGLCLQGPGNTELAPTRPPPTGGSGKGD